VKDKWDKLKIASEALRNNWPQLLLICTLASSGIGNASQYFTIQDKEQEKITAVREVATAFQAVIAEPEKAVEKVRNSGCGSCSILLNSHIKELH